MPEKQSITVVHYYLLGYNRLNASHKFSSSSVDPHRRVEQKYASQKNAESAEGLAESHVSSLSHMSCTQQHIRDGHGLKTIGRARSPSCSVDWSFDEVKVNYLVIIWFERVNCAA